MAHEDKMVNMKLPKPKKHEMGACPATIDEEKYPYGLQLDLSTEALKKLGKSSDEYTVGEQMAVVGMAKVTSTSKRENRHGDNQQSVGIQITDIKIVPAKGMRGMKKKVKDNPGKHKY